MINHPHPNPLVDPALAQPRKEPRSGAEICAERHAAHMAASGQDKWLAGQVESLAAMRAQHDQRLAHDIETGALFQPKVTKKATPKRKPRGAK